MIRTRHFILFLMAMLCHMAWAQVSNTVNVGVMLPLHDVDGDGRRMVEYYRGILMATEKLKEEGMNVNIRAWNVPLDCDIRTTLLKDGASDCNIIFGPLYTKHVKQLGNFCKAYGIKMVIPFSINGKEVEKNSQIYQVYQSNDDLHTTAIQQVVEHFTDYHVVVVDCNDTTSQKGSFTFALRNILEQQGRPANVTNLNSSMPMFTKAFSLTKPNLVIPNTARMPELTQLMTKLDAMQQLNQGVKVSLFGYTEWLMYTKYNKQKYAKFDSYVPTYFYYNEASQLTKDFEQRYRQHFGADMMHYLPHLALTGYDHAMYFIGNRRTWMQTPLKFEKQGTSGGYRNKAFMLIHYKPNGGVEAISY